METKSLCRICFELGHFSLTGYEINVQDNNISIEKMIERFSDIKVNDGNSPEHICENCTHDLVQSYLFTEKIQEADAKILSLSSQFTEQEPIVIYEHEEEVQPQKDPDEEPIDQEINENFSHDENDILELSTIESNIEEENFIEYESAGESVEMKYVSHETHETQSVSPQLVQNEDLSSLYSNFEPYEEDEQDEEPIRKMYKKRNKKNKEVDQGGSFVITQFTSSAASKKQMNNTNLEDNDEVALSDVRVMNFEKVEVTAGNMGVINDDQGELPIDHSRVYLCQYCPRAFSSSAFLVAHVRKSHGCKFCAKVFEKSADLFKHVRELHTTFTCVVCKKNFVSNSNLRNHLKSIHKVKVPAHISLLSYNKQSDTGEES